MLSVLIVGLADGKLEFVPSNGPNQEAVQTTLKREESCWFEVLEFFERVVGLHTAVAALCRSFDQKSENINFR